MFGQVYIPSERVTASHHGSQVSLFFLLTRTVLFLVALLLLLLLLLLLFIIIIIIIIIIIACSCEPDQRADLFSEILSHAFFHFNMSNISVYKFER